MGNVIGKKQDAEYVIFVNQLGQDLLTLQQICEPEDITPVILIDTVGDPA